jgi:hypothetical protein
MINNFKLHNIYLNKQNNIYYEYNYSNWRKRTAIFKQWI